MMTKVPLRVKFLVLLLAGVLAVTVATILVVRQKVENQVRAEISDDLRNSVLTFTAFQTEREATLSRSAELLANLPTLKALMTTEDVATIQDESSETWHLSGGDLMVLAGPSGKVMAVNVVAKEVTPAAISALLNRSFQLSASKQWWFLQGHLYEIFFQPIYFGSSREGRLLGVLALGYEINEGVAKEVSRIAGSEVAFLYGNLVVATTIAPARQAEFTQKFHQVSGAQLPYSADIQLGQERYLSSSIEVMPGTAPSVSLSVLESYDAATARFRDLYRTLVGLGILALFGQSALAFAIFRRYTRPLDKLVAVVRALGKGDFAYPLDVQGRDELAEVTASFIHMRGDLQQTQRKLLESERLATIGRMASSISHDLRHQLTAVVANAEFLSERNHEPEQSEELYQEIRDAVGRMTELIDSLLEFSKTRDALSPSFGSVEETMQRAIRSVQRHPSVQKANITLSCHGNSTGWFDSRKLERVFYNLLLNACQAVAPDSGEIAITMQETPSGVEITVSDNGVGIPENLRAMIFEPFLSYGKENGTGLGLTISQKILEEHGGTIKLADSSPGRTTFIMTVPLGSNADADARDEVPAVISNTNISKE
jgi:signal transduction histidine kinase